MNPMLILVRRFFVLFSLLFWQGGFMFYGAVVVPVGSDFLGSHEKQGMITRTVAIYLNLAGLAALLIWAWDIALAPDPLRRRRRLRWALWTILLVASAVLFLLHRRLDVLLDLGASRVLDRESYRPLHVWYLNVSTVQWAGSLLLLVLTLLAWREADRAAA